MMIIIQKLLLTFGVLLAIGFFGAGGAEKGSKNYNRMLQLAAWSLIIEIILIFILIWIY